MSALPTSAVRPDVARNPIDRFVYFYAPILVVGIPTPIVGNAAFFPPETGLHLHAPKDVIGDMIWPRFLPKPVHDPPPHVVIVIMKT